MEYRGIFDFVDLDLDLDFVNFDNFVFDVFAFDIFDIFVFDIVFIDKAGVPTQTNLV